jgi:hypothetical protein
MKLIVFRDLFFCIQTYPQLEEYQKEEVVRYLEFMASYSLTVDQATEVCNILSFQ